MKLKLNPFPMYLRIRLVESLPDYAGGYTSMIGNDITIELERKYAKELLLHEIVHTIQFIEEFISHRLDDESQAYWTQYLYDICMKYLEKKEI